MKANLLLKLAILIILSFTARAQNVSIGLKAGINSSIMRATKANPIVRELANREVKRINRAQYGLVSNFKISKMFSIQPELLYTMKGTKIESKPDFWNKMNYKKGEIKKEFIELPVLAKASFGNKKFQEHLVLGPYVGYWLSGSSRIEVYDASGSVEIYGQDYNFTNDYDGIDYKSNRLELGINVGVGATYHLDRSAISFDIRYVHGLSDQYKYKYGRDDNMYKTSNQVINASFAYLFSL